MLVNTVRENFEGYTHPKVERAREAGRIQGTIANPTEREFAGMVGGVGGERRALLSSMAATPAPSTMNTRLMPTCTIWAIGSGWGR